MTFVVGPSRKPEFWAAVELHKKADAKKPPVDVDFPDQQRRGKKSTSPAVAVKKPAKKKAKKGGKK